jgi:NADH-quinone oxidoreductase subunit H
VQVLESLGLSPELTWLVWTVFKMLAISIVALTCIPIIIWGERKIAGHIQFRPGPNRVGPYGLLQPIADVLKLVFKEDVKPDKAHTIIYFMAPLVAVIPALVTFTLIPVGPGFVTTDVNVGVLVIFAVASMAVYTVTLAGWAGNNKYSLLGGLRASAQMISYELSMGLSVMGVILIAGSLSLVDIVTAQSGYWFGFIPKWFVFLQPVGFLAFLVTMFAETNRTPFDLPEAEAELVSGFLTEYSSMKYAVFFVGEYLSMLSISAVMVVIFLGGWNGPFLPEAWGGFIWTFAKVTIVFSFFYLVRWTFPRFRYDQLMAFGWKVLLPVTLANVMLTAIIVFFVDGGF